MSKFVLPIKFSFAHKVVVFKQYPETTYIPIDVIDIEEYKLNELNKKKTKFQQILNTISVLTKKEDIINIKGNYIEGKYFEPETPDFFTNFIRKDMPEPQNVIPDKIEKEPQNVIPDKIEQLKIDIEGNKQTSSIMENLKETKSNMDTNIESAIGITEKSEQLEYKLKDQLTEIQTKYKKLEKSKDNKQQTEDKKVALISSSSKIEEKIEEVEKKAKIEAQEFIDKAIDQRKKVLEQIKELDKNLGIRDKLEKFGIINKTEKSERSEDTDIKINIDNIRGKYPFPWEEIYQFLIDGGFIDDKLIVGGKGGVSQEDSQPAVSPFPFYYPPYYLVVLNDQKTPTNIIPLNYQGKALFDIKMYIHKSGIKIGETRIILDKIASYFNTYIRLNHDFINSKIRTEFIDLNTIYQTLFTQQNSELNNANNAILTLEQISENLQDRKDFFYYIFFLREKIMNIFKNIENEKDGLNSENVININKIIEPLKKKYLLSKEQQLDYETKYENYIKHENRVNYSKTNKTNKTKSPTHNKTTKVR